jgi:hypothetical protein
VLEVEDLQGRGVRADKAALLILREKSDHREMGEEGRKLQAPADPVEEFLLKPEGAGFLPLG